MIPCLGNKGQQEVPSSVLSSQAGDDGLPGKQKAKEGHGKAHPEGQVLSLVPHKLQGDIHREKERERNVSINMLKKTLHMVSEVRPGEPW